MEIYRALFLHPSFKQEKEYKWFVLLIQEDAGRGRLAMGGGTSTEGWW